MNLTEKEKQNIDVPDHFLCSISLEIMEDPVICSDGITYERYEITKWLDSNNTSPKTNNPLTNKTLIPNFALKSAISKYLSTNISHGYITRNKAKKARQASDNEQLLIELDGPTTSFPSTMVTANTSPVTNTTTLNQEAQSTKVQIFVRLITSATITITMDSINTTVKDLMEEISQTEGIKPAQQRLIFAGKQLDPNMKLSQYNIQSGSIVHLILRLLGGG